MLGDVAAWRAAVETSEAHSAPVPRLRKQMEAIDANLAAWVKSHRYLVPTEVERGESGMALLLLWEVDHGRRFTTMGDQGLSCALAGFSRRLELRVTQDPQLAWLSWREMNVPLCPGLVPSYHRRWSVRGVAPAAEEPRGWYEEFLQRWRAFLEVLAQPRGSQNMLEVSAEQLARVRPREEQPVVAVTMTAGSVQEGRQGRTQEREERPKKKRTTAPPQARGSKAKKRGREEIRHP